MQGLEMIQGTGMEEALRPSPHDVEQALDAMHRDLALRQVRRCLRHAALDGRTARALADLAADLQAD